MPSNEQSWSDAPASGLECLARALLCHATTMKNTLNHHDATPTTPAARRLEPSLAGRNDSNRRLEVRTGIKAGAIIVHD
jgi:hypothetical protein